MKKEFLDAKQKAIKSLEKACSENNADNNIISLLDIINNIESCYTTSSCSGRTVLLEIPKIGDKKGAKFLGKWHDIVSLKDIKNASINAKKGLIWILAQSPVIHIGCANINIADKLLKISIASGFKNSGLKSTNKNIILEICSTERLDSPVGRDGILFCNDEYLQLLVDISNEIYSVSKVKIHQFEDNLQQNIV
jgi:tRNA wybutosine-synthesizing protein 3